MKTKAKHLFFGRAAMTLLLAVVTTATATAQEAIVGLTYNSTAAATPSAD